MSEVLTQNEIDELLKALDEGDISVTQIETETTEKKIRPYDFRRPNKFAKDQLRTLQIIHDNFSRLLASFISGILRTYCQVEVVSVEPQTYHEFTNSLPEPVILSIVDFKPLKGAVILELSPDISYILIDRLLGGVGKSSSIKRNFTDIEIALLERILRQVLPLISESWANILSTDLRLTKIETNPQFVQILSPNETIAIVTMRISIGEVEGIMNICIPHLVIEPVLDQLSTRFWFSSKIEETTERKSELISKQIEATTLEMKAVLGTSIVSINEFLSLQIGDVIQLDKRVEEPVTVMAGSMNKFSGVMGIKNKKMAIQITSVDKGD